ncbi:MAG: outer membrane beta-barrel protein [Wenzhouxiangella sp.]
MKTFNLQQLAGAAILLSACMTGSALAGPTGSIGYTQLVDVDGVDLGAIYGSAGFEFDLGPNVSVTPELRVGFGVTDDTLFGIDVELRRLYGLATRVNYNANNGLYLFATASYVNYEFKASAFGSSASEDTWEFGIGAGLGFYFTERLGLELQYENVDSEDVISAGLRLRF